MTSELLETDKFEGSSYEVIAWARGETVIGYWQFGSYQGEWVLVSRTSDGKSYKIYKGYYGSCSGCDSYEAEMGYGDVTRAQGLKFAEGYQEFLLIPKQTMRNLCKNRNLVQVFPANFREEYGDISLKEVVNETLLWTLLDEKLPIQPKDILDCPNQELRRRGIEQYGAEKFFKNVEKEEIDSDEGNYLIRIGTRMFVYLKDSSTKRRYLLQVPPDARTVKGAVAWTFGMTEKQYKPIIEA